MFRKFLSLAVLFSCSTFTFGQQSQQLFFMHYLPESNLMNPAIQSPCPWYIGLPVVSSIHANYGNSGFSYTQLFKKNNEGVYEPDIDGTVSKLKNRNFIGTELHLQLFALGHRRGDYYFNFSITEKNNLPATYSKDLVSLLWDGNTPIEGQQARLKGTGAYFMHYREYAFGVSKFMGEGTFVGAKAKVLFGKLNTSFRKNDTYLYTDPNTFDLRLNGDLEIHTSLPLIVESDTNGITSVELDEDADILELLLNRKNPGIAFDIGVIRPLDERTVLSASLLDLGFIRWRSNLNTFTGSGDFVYEGPLSDTANSDTYFQNLWDSFIDSMSVTSSQEKYTTFLPPRLTLGVQRTYTDWFKAGVQGSAILHRSKILPSLTVSGDIEPVQHLHFMFSYTLAYGGYNNIGAGMVVARNPLQFFIVSDNMLGTVLPLSARNLNLRFGFNLNIGCNEKDDAERESMSTLVGACHWAEEDLRQPKKRKHRQKR